MKMLEEDIDVALDEQARLNALHELEIWDAPNVTEFDEIVKLVGHALDCPIVLISLLDLTKQRFLSGCGFALNDIERKGSFCDFAIRGDGLMEVPDLTADPRFSEHPLVADSPEQKALRFYAGAPLITFRGYKLGTLCILDTTPRYLSDGHKEQLTLFAKLIIEKIEMRRAPSRRDALTSLYNRQQFMIDLRATPPEATGESRTIALMELFDLTALRATAQVIGIEAVESAVRLLSKRLVNELQSQWPSIEIYHVGTTRFAIVMPETALAEIDPWLRHLKKMMERPVRAQTVTISPSFKVGLAVVRNGTDEESDGLRRAMVALDSCSKGGYSWRLYDTLIDESVSRTFKLVAQVEQAIRFEQFVLVYQPRIELGTSTTVCVEALIRWHHPELGIVMPGEFIPGVERTVAMHALTRWVIRSSCAQAAQWQREERHVKISFNVSATDFDDTTLVPALQAALTEYGITGSLLEMEITEGALLSQSPQVIAQLHEIRQLGIDVAIDDFGTGYSNFAYLDQIPANVIKIDQSLTKNLCENNRQTIIVRSMIRLAKDLGYRVVAEGIENKEVLKYLRIHGCDEAQGFGIARPSAAEKVFL